MIVVRINRPGGGRLRKQFTWKSPRTGQNSGPRFKRRWLENVKTRLHHPREVDDSSVILPCCPPSNDNNGITRSICSSHVDQGGKEKLLGRPCCFLRLKCFSKMERKKEVHVFSSSSFLSIFVSFFFPNGRNLLYIFFLEQKETIFINDNSSKIVRTTSLERLTNCFQESPRGKEQWCTPIKRTLEARERFFFEEVEKKERIESFLLKKGRPHVVGAFCEPVYTFEKSPSPVIHSVFRVVNKQADHCEDEFSGRRCRGPPSVCRIEQKFSEEIINFSPNFWNFIFVNNEYSKNVSILTPLSIILDKAKKGVSSFIRRSSVKMLNEAEKTSHTIFFFSRRMLIRLRQIFSLLKFPTTFQDKKKKNRFTVG